MTTELPIRGFQSHPNTSTPQTGVCNSSLGACPVTALLLCPVMEPIHPMVHYHTVTKAVISSLQVAKKCAQMQYIQTFIKIYVAVIPESSVRSETNSRSFLYLKSSCSQRTSLEHELVNGWSQPVLRCPDLEWLQFHWRILYNNDLGRGDLNTSSLLPNTIPFLFYLTEDHISYSACKVRDMCLAP